MNYGYNAADSADVRVAGKVASHKQDISPATSKAITAVGRLVSDDISQPPEGISNISEWCKKDACWSRLKGKLAQTGDILPVEFISELVPIEAINEETKDAAKTQKIDNGIQAQSRVLEYSGQQWRFILEAGIEKGIYSQKEIGILEVAAKIPHKLPSEKQSVILMDILEKAALEGIVPV